MSRPAAAVHRVIKAYDVRGLVGEEIDEQFVADVGGAFARLVRDGDPGGATQVVIGYDMRSSSPSLADAFAEGVVAQGLDVTRIGLASTDQLYFASGLLDCPGAMFTASHNPAAYNGIKLCRAGAKPVGKDTGLTAISDDVIAGVPRYDGASGAIHDRDVLADYGEFLRSLVDLSGLRSLRVAVDAGNGMAGHTTPAVLGPIPSITLEPLYFELDGTFPNHEANPLDPANLVDLQEHVLSTGADIGLAFDGDADRCFVVDELGHPVSPSAVTALVAARELHREIGATVIHNLITSRAVPELVTERGGTPVRSRVGHSYIKALMADTGAIFGGEHSAHYYFRDFWGADSGMLAALHVLAALGEQQRPLSELMADYQRYESSGEINFTVGDAASCVEAVLKSFGTRIHSIDHLDGVTVDLGNGSWFNLRSSNTEPLLRLNAEARSVEEVDEIVGQVSTGPSPDRVGLGGGHMNATRATVDLDDAEGLLAADRDGLLRAASMAGAQVRATAAALEEGVLDPVASDQPPRTVIWVAGRGAAETAGSMLAAALGGSVAAPIVVASEAPPWIGALDVLVIAGDDPGDPALVSAAATGVRRGARVVVVAPYEGPLRDATAGRAAVLAPRVRVPDDFGLAGYLGAGLATLRVVDPGLVMDLAAIADELDAEALRDSATRELFTNPAKTLADRMSGRDVLLAGDNAATLALARHGGAVLLRVAHQAGGRGRSGRCARRTARRDGPVRGRL